MLWSASTLVPVSGNSLVAHGAGDREARINGLNGVEFSNMRYNDAVAAALNVWGPERPRVRSGPTSSILC